MVSGHKHNVLYLDLLTKRLGNFIPDEQVHPEREVAFLGCFPQVADLPGLSGSGEYHQIEIGSGMRGPVCAGTVDPGGRAGQILFEQCRDRLALPGGDVDGPVYSHVSQVVV